MLDADFCRVDGNEFIIVESLHASDAFKISEFVQVYRQVIQLCNYEKYKFDGEPLSGVPSQSQYIKDFLSRRRRITTHPTGRNTLYYVYRGVRNSFRPIANLNIEGALAGKLSKSYNFGLPIDPFALGQDPVPDIQLTLRNDVHFVMPGNKPPPTAIAIYNKDSGTLHEVKNLVDRKKIIGDLSELGSRRF